IFGGMALGFNLNGHPRWIGTGWSTVLTFLGVTGMLYHAAFDRDIQFRRLYMGFGLVLLLVGAALCLIPYSLDASGSIYFSRLGVQLRWGVPALVLALCFLLA